MHNIDQSFNYVAMDERVTTSGLPTIEQLADLEQQGYTALINLLPDDNEYAVAGEREAVQAQAVEYVYIPVDYAVPNKDDFTEFVSTMRRLHGQKIHIHCAANYRVSAFYGLYQLVEGNWTREQMDSHVHSLFKPADYPPWPEFIDAIAASVG